MSNYNLNHSRILDNSCTKEQFYNELYNVKGVPTIKQKKFFWRLYYLLKDNNIIPCCEFINSRGLLINRIDRLKAQCEEYNLLK